MGGKLWEWEGICIREREVRLGSQETVTAKPEHSIVCMDVCICGCNLGTRYYMYDGWLIISLSAWGKMTGDVTLFGFLSPLVLALGQGRTSYHTHKAG